MNILGRSLHGVLTKDNGGPFLAHIVHIQSSDVPCQALYSYTSHSILLLKNTKDSKSI